MRKCFARFTCSGHTDANQVPWLLSRTYRPSPLWLSSDLLLRTTRALCLLCSLHGSTEMQIDSHVASSKSTRGVWRRIPKARLETSCIETFSLFTHYQSRVSLSQESTQCRFKSMQLCVVSLNVKGNRRHSSWSSEFWPSVRSVKDLLHWGLQIRLLHSIFDAAPLFLESSYTANRTFSRNCGKSSIRMQLTCSKPGVIDILACRITKARQVVCEKGHLEYLISSELKCMHVDLITSSQFLFRNETV